MIQSKYNLPFDVRSIECLPAPKIDLIPVTPGTTSLSKRGPSLRHIS